MWRFLGFVALVIGGLAAVFYYTGQGEERRILQDKEKQTGSTVIKSPLAPVKPITQKVTVPTNAQSGQLFGGAVTIPGMELKPKEDTEITAEVDGAIIDLKVDVGQVVKVGDVLLKIDDRVMRAKLQEQELNAGELSDKKIEAADKEFNLYHEELGRAERGGQSVSDSEKAIARARRDLSFIKKFQSRIEQAGEKAKLQQVKEQLDLYEVKARIPGTVVKVYKKRGNNVRQGEPVIQIVNDKTLMAEGSVEAGFTRNLKVGMTTVIEPENDRQPLVVYDGHTAAVTSLALAPAERFLASSSEDGSIILWNIRANSRLPWKKLERTDRRRVGCRALAISPAVTGNGDTFRILSGYTDGAVILWTVKINSADQVTLDAKTLDKVHDEGVECVAFRGDGLFAATGSTDRKVAIWDMNQGKKLYYVHDDQGQHAHYGAVTSVNFSKDGKHLFTMGTDNALRRWELGADNCVLRKEITGRSGDIRQVNLADDGRYLFFEQGDELRMLNASTLDQVSVMNSRRSGRFVQFAQFSPTGLLAIAPTDQGRNFLLRLPNLPDAGKNEPVLPTALKTGTNSTAITPQASPPSAAATAARATTPELWVRDGAVGAQFTLPEAVKATCAVFTPELGAKEYVFLGSSDSKIRVYEVPSASDLNTPILARLKFISPQVESGTGLIRVQAEFENPPARRLETGKRATVIVYPDAVDR
jgi:WD40 repeat protein/biotin carboxyl carrier protein